MNCLLYLDSIYLHDDRISGPTDPEEIVCTPQYKREETRINSPRRVRREAVPDIPLEFWSRISRRSNHQHKRHIVAYQGSVCHRNVDEKCKVIHLPRAMTHLNHWTTSSTLPVQDASNDLVVSGAMARVRIANVDERVNVHPYLAHICSFYRGQSVGASADSECKNCE